MANELTQRAIKLYTGRLSTQQSAAENHEKLEKSSFMARVGHFAATQASWFSRKLVVTPKGKNTRHKNRLVTRREMRHTLATRN